MNQTIRQHKAIHRVAILDRRTIEWTDTPPPPPREPEAGKWIALGLFAAILFSTLVNFANG